MKRTILFVLIIVLPLLLFAGSTSLLHKMRDAKLPFADGRGWRMTERIQSQKDTGTWVIDSKFVYHYNNANSSRIDSMLVYSYDPDAMEYALSMVYRYQYHASGRIAGVTGYVVFPGMGYIPMIRTSSTYDAQNRITHYYLDMADFMSGVFLPYGRFHFVYSGAALTTLYSWMSSTEKVGTYWKSDLTCDPQGRVIVELEQESPDSLSWVNSLRTESTYHANDTSTGASAIEYMSTVLPGSFGADTFTLMGMPTQYLSTTWNGSTWVNSERDTYTWNATNNHLISHQLDTWNASWNPNYKDVFTYDNNGNISLWVESNYSSSTWNEVSKEEIFWQNYTAVEDNNAPAVADLKLQTFPMPFSQQLTIIPTSKSVQDIDLFIYNQKGQLIRDLKGKAGQNTVWNGLDRSGNSCATGMYYLKATQAGHSVTTIIIKLK